MDNSKPTASVFVVLYFGDSLTAGSTFPPDQKHCVWHALVQEASHGKFQAINEGQNGRSTNSVAGFQKVLKELGNIFDIVVITLGENDSRDISGNCVPHAVRNIREMITLSRAARPNTPILLVGPANLRKDTLGPTKPIANQRDQNLRDLTVAFEKLAQEISCPFVSLYGTIPPASLAVDGVHPDAEGNRPIAAKMLKALNKLVAH